MQYTVHISRGPIYERGLTLILSWISSHMPSKVSDEITYPFPNFNGCTVEVWEWINNSISLYDGCNYLPPLGLKLNHVSKRGPWHIMPTNLPCVLDPEYIAKGLPLSVHLKKKTLRYLTVPTVRTRFWIWRFVRWFCNGFNKYFIPMNTSAQNANICNLYGNINNMQYAHHFYSNRDMLMIRPLAAVLKICDQNKNRIRNTEN